MKLIIIITGIISKINMNNARFMPILWNTLMMLRSINNPKHINPIIKPISGPSFMPPVKLVKNMGTMMKNTAPAWMHALAITHLNSLFTSALVMTNPIFKMGIHDPIIRLNTIPAYIKGTNSSGAPKSWNNKSITYFKKSSFLFDTINMK